MEVINLENIEDIDFENFHNEKLAEMPIELVKNCVEFLKNDMPENVKNDVRKEYKKDPINWCTPYHFHWGMYVRNTLRKAGFTDDQLPSGNWDDYYVPIVELACGVRKMEGINNEV